MEISTEQKEELKTIVEKNPQGLTFNELYSKAKSFSDETELSCGVHEVVKDGICTKINGKYYPKNNVQMSPSVNSDAVTKEIKSLLAVNGVTSTETSSEPFVETNKTEGTDHKVVVSQTKRTSVQPAEAPRCKVPPCGTLRRSSTKGVIAYALYKVRGDVLTRKELNLLFTKETTSGAIYQAILSLVTIGMIEKASSEFSNMSYRWTDQFGYPFPHTLKEDKHIVPFKDYEEFLKFKERALKPPPQGVTVLLKTGSPEIDGLCSIPDGTIIDGIECAARDVVKEAERTVPYKPVSEALSMIRASISHHEAQIAMLRNLESKLEMAI